MNNLLSKNTIAQNHYSEEELDARLSRAYQISEAAVQAGVTPGAALAVGNAAHAVMHCTGVTTMRQGGAVVTKDTLYDLASISKIYTTALALLLLDRGDLRLDDQVALFLPEFICEDKREITVRHLMTHTSGLKAHENYYKKVHNSADMRRLICEDELNAPVGSEVCYSCLGYISLAGVIERVYGMPLDAAMRRYLVEPLGLTATGYNPQASRETIAPTEDCSWRGLTAWGEVHDENAYAQGGISGNAGVFSSLNDMVAFAQMWLRMGLAKDGYLLSPLTVASSIQSQTDDLGGERRGLGWQLRSRRLSFMGDLAPESCFGHTGFTGTSIALNPEQGTFVVWLTNRVHPTRNETRHIRYRALLHNAIWAALAT